MTSSLDCTYAPTSQWAHLAHTVTMCVAAVQVKTQRALHDYRKCEYPYYKDEVRPPSRGCTVLFPCSSRSVLSSCVEQCFAGKQLQLAYVFA